MAALRALVFAVFGGFIGAAPVAPVVAGGAGQSSFLEAGSQSQKREKGGYEALAPATPIRAAAPPCTDTPLSAAGTPTAAVLRPPFATCAPLCASRGREVAPLIEDIRAGLLDLPPPAR